MKVAIASSGLGHVARGVETWALDTAVALAGRGADVALFAAGQVKVSDDKNGSSLVWRCPQSVTGSLNKSPDLQIDESSNSRIPESPVLHSFSDGGTNHPIHQIIVLPCLRRSDARAHRLVKSMPGFMWRLGLKTAYGWEQLSFWRYLWPKLRRGKFDILHVQDPMLAFWCRKFRRLGLVKTKVILAHGTEEPIEFLEQFEFVQQLAPWHLEQTVSALNARGSGFRVQGSGRAGRKDQSSIRPHWVAMPNFVDVKRFAPASAKRGEVRAEFDIPDNAFVVIAVGALKRVHKRIDWLISEFGRFLEITGKETFLLLVGASTSDTPELRELAGKLNGERIRFLADEPREHMPGLLASADVFVHAALFEMMPIAFLEAMASRLPIVSNGHPVMQWMAGEGGVDVDMTKQDDLAHALLRLQLSLDLRKKLGRLARERAEQMFSKDVVIGQYMEYYRTI